MISSGDSFKETWRGYIGLRNLRVENEELSQDVSELKFRLQEQQAIIQSVDRLERFLEFRQRLSLATLSARVIAKDATPYFLTLIVDRGLQDGVRSEMAVLAPNGIVGRVIGQPGERAARVQLLIDRNAGAGTMIERTRASGVVIGNGDDQFLQMEYVSNFEDVMIGDRIVTSGIDKIYPKGFSVGTVIDVAKGTGLHQEIRIKSAIDFSRLEEVLIVINAFPVELSDVENK
jgi:rod shape-determining protein MreC